jgi:uncharacterized protein YgiM (DUF1202 family)
MNLRITFLTLGFCLLCFRMSGESCAATPVSHEFFPFLAEVTAENVNVRAGQSENFEKLCRLKRGEEVVVVGKSYSWYKIQLPKISKSFVSDKYVQLLKGNIGRITGDRINIRAGGGINYTVIGQLSAGREIQIQERLEGWYKIIPVEDSYGWISDQFLLFKSKDIKNYRSKLVSIAEVNKTRLVESVKNLQSGSAEKRVEGHQEQSTEIKVQEIIKDNKSVTFTGYLEPQNNPEFKDIQYKLAFDGQPTYFIQGLQQILDEFQHYKVRIEGTINKDAQDHYPYPVIVVSKIQLVL